MSGNNSILFKVADLVKIELEIENIKAKLKMTILLVIFNHHSR